ncbi:hypothetical protein AURDEDRAFT_159543 [Auricularia subglabra TFB-10046 SS5]|nr:hypothetical protein AURDEDRAFT_159543 [Auricularia subglabra TFB-10046 SS5]
MPRRFKKMMEDETALLGRIAVPGEPPPQSSQLDKLPLELLTRICELMHEHIEADSGQSSTLMSFRQANRQLCRIASSVLNREVSLQNMQRIQSFFSCFLAPRRSLRRNSEDVAAYSPLTAFLPDDIRTLRLRERNPEYATYWKRKFAVTRLHEQVVVTLPSFRRMTMFDWRMADSAPAALLDVLAKCPRLTTLFLEESLAQPAKADRLSDEQLLRGRRYPPQVQYLYLQVSAVCATEHLGRWNEYLATSFSWLENLRTLSLNVINEPTDDVQRAYGFIPDAYSVDKLLHHTFPHLRALALRGVVVKQADDLVGFFGRHPQLHYFDFRVAHSALPGAGSLANNWHSVMCAVAGALASDHNLLPNLSAVSVIPDPHAHVAGVLLDGMRPLETIALDLHGTIGQATKALAVHYARGRALRQLLLFNAVTRNLSKEAIKKIAAYTPSLHCLRVFGPVHHDGHIPPEQYKDASLDAFASFFQSLTAWSHLCVLEVSINAWGLWDTKEFSLALARRMLALESFAQLRTLILHWGSSAQFSTTHNLTWTRGSAGVVIPESIECVVEHEPTGGSKSRLGIWPKVWPQEPPWY